MSCTIWLPRISSGVPSTTFWPSCIIVTYCGHAQRDVHVVLDQQQRDLRVEPEQQLGEALALAARETRRPARRASSASGRSTLAMPTSSCRCCPCESEPTSECSESASQTRSAAAWARSRSARSRAAECTAPQAAALAADDREVEVVLDRQAREEPGLLVRPCDAEPRPHARGEVGDVGAHHVDRAAGRHEVARDQVEQRRLAGAVGPENGAALAVRDVEIDVAHGLHPTETPADPPQAEDRAGVSGDGSRRLSQRVTVTR